MIKTKGKALFADPILTDPSFADPNFADRHLRIDF
jgi:hypothetical protein